MTASRHSRIDFGCPGRLTNRDDPRIPAVCRLRIAVGTFSKETFRISSPNPGIIFSHTSWVASGVTSRGAGPVPPVVMIRQHCSSSHILCISAAMICRSSETIRYSGDHGETSTSRRYSQIAGPPRSSYSPRLARSETVSTPIRTGISTAFQPSGERDERGWWASYRGERILHY